VTPRADPGSLRFDPELPDAASARFFATTPLAVAAAGALLLIAGGSAFVSHWSHRTLALTHLGTLGFLTMALLGFLVAWIPAETRGRGRNPRAARVTHALLLAGLTGLVVGLLSGARALLFAALALLTAAMLLFLGPAAAALARASTPSPVLSGLRLAVASLFGVALLGLWMAHGKVGVPLPGPRELWIQVHLSVGFLGWVGSLLVVTAWPAAEPEGSDAARARRATLRWIASGVALSLGVLLLEWLGAFAERVPLAQALAAVGALPAAAAIWLREPLRALRAGPAEREPAGAGFRRSGLALAFATAVAALAAAFLPDARWTLLFGWLAIWGWAGMLVHGLLLERLPALLAQRRAVAPLPGAWPRRACGLHAASVAIGAVAILARSDALARLTGLALVATALQLGACLHRLRGSGEPAGPR